MFDLEKTALLVGAALKERKETVAVAESSSGGLICAALLAVPGASSYFKGGGVVYTSQAKTLLVEVSAEEMQKKRAATEEHAIALPAPHASASVPIGASAKRAPPAPPATAMATRPVILVSRWSVPAKKQGHWLRIARNAPPICRPLLQRPLLCCRSA